MKGILIKHHGQPSIFHFESLTDIGDKLFDGSPVQLVRSTFDEKESYALLVDEEGLFKPDAAINYVASIMAGQTLLGDAVMVRTDRDIEGLSAKQIRAISALLALWGMEVQDDA